MNQHEAMAKQGKPGRVNARFTYEVPVPVGADTVIGVTGKIDEDEELRPGKVLVIVVFEVPNTVLWIVVVRVWVELKVTGVMTGTTTTELVTTTYETEAGGETPPNQEVVPLAITKLRGPVAEEAVGLHKPKVSETSNTRQNAGKVLGLEQKDRAETYGT